MIKDTIIHLWESINRPGSDDLIRFLESSDFYQAPCSMKNHLAKPGGLAEHCHNVFKCLLQKVTDYQVDIPNESVIICGLGHDICKVNFYHEGGEPCSRAQYDYLCSLWLREKSYIKEKPSELVKFLENEQFIKSIPSPSATVLINWLKNNPGEPMPELPVVYSIDDMFPYGHGEKSVSILQDYIKLTEEEKLAIRWHMGAWDLSETGRYAFNNAVIKTPLVTLLTSADFEVSHILERKEGIES